MLKALIVNSDNLEACKELLHVAHIPERALDEVTWIVWGDELWPEVRLLPHIIFQDRYNVIGPDGDDYLVEPIV
jgi:hypothetical protein